MNEYASTMTLDQAATLIRQSPRVVVTTHAKPDGDAMGSVLALTESLRAGGKTVRGWLIPPITDSLRSLRGADRLEEYTGSDAQRLGDADLLVILDTGAYGQLGGLRRSIETRLAQTLIVDHHLTGDVPAAHRFIDGTAAACCEVVADLVTALDGTGPQSLAVCEALFVGIASDTGWFRFSNTSPRTLELAARLLRQGVDHAALYRRLEQGDRPQKLALLTRALQSLTLHEQGRVAVMTLRASDFAQTGAMLEETERFIDLPQIVQTVELVVLITEPPPEARTTTPARRAEDKLPGAIRVSFRSKPPMPGADDAVNVAQLAGKFGGGGHARASGAKINADWDEVVNTVVAAAQTAVRAMR